MLSGKREGGKESEEEDFEEFDEDIIMNQPYECEAHSNFKCLRNLKSFES